MWLTLTVDEELGLSEMDTYFERIIMSVVVHKLKF